jgi:hypothetical protein
MGLCLLGQKHVQCSTTRWVVTRGGCEVEAETGLTMTTSFNLGDGKHSDLERKQDRWTSNLQQELVRL